MAKEIYVKRVGKATLYHSKEHYIYNMYKKDDKLICICSDHKLVGELSLYTWDSKRIDVIPYGDGPLTTTDIIYYIMKGERHVRNRNRNSNHKHN